MALTDVYMKGTCEHKYIHFSALYTLLCRLQVTKEKAENHFTLAMVGCQSLGTV